MKKILMLALLACPLATAAQDTDAEADALAAAEAAYHEIRAALARGHSAAPEDADVMVCRRRNVTGTRIPALECATNRHWRAVIDDTADEYVHRGRSDEKFSMPWSEYRRLERRFGGSDGKQET